MTRARLSIAAVSIAVLAAAVFAVVHSPWIVNTSESMPLGIYRSETLRTGPGSDSRPLARGDTIVVCLPEWAARIAIDRHYLYAGSCPGGVVTALKLIAGVAGDRVKVRRSGIYIDGRRLPHSKRYAVDTEGRSLPELRLGDLVVPRGQLWLWTPSPASFDSRYFGLVPAANVRARARLVLPFGSWGFSSDLPVAAP